MLGPESKYAGAFRVGAVFRQSQSVSEAPDEAATSAAAAAAASTEVTQKGARGLLLLVPLMLGLNGKVSPLIPQRSPCLQPQLCSLPSKITQAPCCNVLRQYCTGAASISDIITGWPPPCLELHVSQCMVPAPAAHVWAGEQQIYGAAAGGVAICLGSDAPRTSGCLNDCLCVRR